MTVTVVIRAATAQVQAVPALAEPAPVVLGEAFGLGPLAPWAAQAVWREAERRAAVTAGSSPPAAPGPGPPSSVPTSLVYSASAA